MAKLAHYAGFSVEIGETSGDVFCPHGKRVDVINKYDYALNPSQQTRMVRRSDLAQWVKEYAADTLEHVCGYGH